MERSDGKKNDETVRIRMSTELLKRIQAAKVPFGWGEEADSSFARHLLILGMDEVEQVLHERVARQRARVKASALIDEEFPTDEQLTKDPEPAYVPEIKVYRPPEFDSNAEFLGEDVVYLPYYGRTAAGKPISFETTPGEVVPWAKAMIKGDPSRYFIVQAQGSSMTEAGIQNSDLTLIRRAEAPRQNRIMLIRHGNESTLKRIKMKGDQEVYMCWEDGSGQAVRLDDQDYEIQGEYIGIMRG